MNDNELNIFLQSLLQPLNSSVEPSADASIKLLFERRLLEVGLSQYQIEKLLSTPHRSRADFSQLCLMKFAPQ